MFNVSNAPIKEEKAENVREMVKSELIREHLENDVISFNTKLVKWMENAEENVTKDFKLQFDENIDVVDEDGDGELDKHRISPLKSDKNCLQMPIESGHDEVLWINEICRRMQIRFDQEEIVEGKLKEAKHYFWPEFFPKFFHFENCQNFSFISMIDWGF